MSKVIVVEQCSRCPKSSRSYEGYILSGYNCAPAKGFRPLKCPEKGIPEWCPLPDFPERKEEMDYLATGYNKCLDDILEGEE